MATFAKATFNAVKYATSRPTYPPALFNAVLAYHAQSLSMPGATTGWNRALDLGCGTGQATIEILKQAQQVEEQDEDSLPRFNQVIGVDPSSKMVSEAQVLTAKLGLPDSAIRFVQSPAEDLHFVEDKSVDLVIAAQAAHWFDWERMWPELSRVLKYGGTAAFWVYSEFRLPQYPHLTPLITEYAGTQGTNPYTSLGPYWEPGRKILANHLLDIAPPSTGWDDVTRVFFTGDYYPDLPDPKLPVIMSKTMTWGGTGLHGYLRTFSALHSYHETFPEDLKRADGDIATRFLRTLMEKAKVPLGEDGKNAEVEVEWPLALVVARKELDPTDPWRIRLQKFQTRVNQLQKAYDLMSSASEDPTNLEGSQEKLNKWIAAQAQVWELAEEDLKSLAEEKALPGLKSIAEKGTLPGLKSLAEEGTPPVEITAGLEALAKLQAGEDPDADIGMARYLSAIEGIRFSVSWHLSFIKALEYALELAQNIEHEGGLDNAAGAERWFEQMTEKINSLTSPALSEGSEYITEEQYAPITSEQVAGHEEAEKLAGILALVQGLVESVPSEPIADLVRGVYVSSSTEVARELIVE